jgi:hypothetical protein
MKKYLAIGVCLLGLTVLFGSTATWALTTAQMEKLLASDGAVEDLFGSAIAIDGNTAVIGSPWDDDNGEFSGSAYVFTRTQGEWIEQAKLVPSDGAPYGLFSYSVAIEGDTAIIGALGSEPDWGSAYVFTRTDGVWTEQAKLMAFDGAEIDYLGHSVAIDGDTAIVGAPDWTEYTQPGSTYVFTRTADVWTQQAKLEVAGIQAGHKFGHEVTLDDDTVIIGAFGVGPDYSGAAYVFTRTNGAWTEQAKLETSHGAVNDYFGFGVVLEGDTAIIGAPRDETNGDSSGSAYVFTRTDGVSPAWFGKIVDLDGNTALIGSPYDDDNGHWSGSAYVFIRVGSVWVEQSKMLASDGAADDGFGFALGLDGDTAIIGAAWEEDGPGSAYVFRLITVVQPPNPFGSGVNSLFRR